MLFSLKKDESITAKMTSNSVVVGGIGSGKTERVSTPNMTI